MNIFTLRDEAAYLHAAEPFPKLKALLQLMLLQGLRPDELLSLQIDQLNFERRYMKFQLGNASGYTNNPYTP